MSLFNMAACLKRGLISINSSRANWGSSYQIVRHHWHRDWKPGPYPETREAAEASAKKYGIHPDEYEPYPNDGFGVGDYPNFKPISNDSKDPYYPYDYPEHKKNFNETWHLHSDIYGGDRLDISRKPRFSPTYQVTTFLAAVLGSFALYFICDYKPMVVPVLPKQYPKPGEVHYTFESANCQC